MASNIASDPEATNEPELTCFPFDLTYRPRMIFTTTATAIMTSETMLYRGISGSMIFNGLNSRRDAGIEDDAGNDHGADILYPAVSKRMLLVATQS